MTIVTQKTANLGGLKESVWQNNQKFAVVDEELSRQFKTTKQAPTIAYSGAKEKKYQTQVIKNLLRNLVRKKHSPTRKVKKSKSKNPEGFKKGSKESSVKKHPESAVTSKSRKLNKLFNRKNLSLSLENRKLVKETAMKFKPEIPRTSTVR